jgi:2-polyprenyl-3-methyl-5-hydroxy-6-metoxy-1,4-benzoquinol methylase
MTRLSAKSSSEFWDVLAAHHAAIEDNYLDLRSIRCLLPELRELVLVVGAGQGLIVSELRSKGLRCDGLDVSAEMIKFAKARRGIDLIHADARATPFPDGRYATVVYATGVIDFIGDENEIRAILAEGRRITEPSGKMFVAFYRVSAPMEAFMIRMGLLRNHVTSHRESLELYLLTPAQTLRWAAERAQVGRLRAAAMLILLWLRSSIREKAMTLRMQKLMKKIPDARVLINAAGDNQPYRNGIEIRNLFGRLGIPIKQVHTTTSCFIVQI